MTKGLGDQDVIIHTFRNKFIQQLLYINKCFGEYVLNERQI